MLKAALCGGYVNFGVFGLYGDNALEKALKTFVELLSSIPHSNLLVSCRVRVSWTSFDFGLILLCGRSIPVLLCQFTESQRVREKKWSGNSWNVKIKIGALVPY